MLLGSGQESPRALGRSLAGGFLCLQEGQEVPHWAVISVA